MLYQHPLHTGPLYDVEATPTDDGWDARATLRSVSIAGHAVPRAVLATIVPRRVIAELEEEAADAYAAMLCGEDEDLDGRAA